MNQVKILITQIKPDLFKLNIEADIIKLFSPLPDIIAECRRYGTVYSSRLPYPSRCQATGKGLEVAVVGKKSTAIMEVISYSDAPWEEPIQSFQCELVSELTGAITRGSLERIGQSQYEISYQPTIKGRNQLHIKVEDQHIRGSPFLVAVKLPIEKLGTPILTINEVDGITFTQRWEVVVAERDRHCVTILNSRGQFQYPCGVTVDGEGSILVADCWNHRIQKLTTKGQFLTSVGTY